MINHRKQPLKPLERERRKKKSFYFKAKVIVKVNSGCHESVTATRFSDDVRAN